MSGRDARQNLKQSVTDSDMRIVDININSLYSAPSDWNRWSQLPDNKFAELVESLLTTGQQQPCVVWKISKDIVKQYYDEHEFKHDAYGLSGNEYMILAGHNRIKARKAAYPIREKEIVEIRASLPPDELDWTEEEEAAATNEFEYAPCIIEEGSADDPETIKRIINIIIDTNYHSRNNTPQEIYNAIIMKYKNYSDNSNKDKSVNIANSIADDLNIGRATVFRYLKLQNLIPAFQQPMFTGVLPMKSAVYLSEFDADQQQFIYNKWFFEITDKKNGFKILSKLEPHMQEKHMNQIVEAELGIQEYTTVTIKLPKYLEKEFRKYASNWINSRKDVQ